jgi:hypothetical protein
MILMQVEADIGEPAMSIVSYHARVGESLLEALQTNPDLFWELPKNAGPVEAELFFIDKDWRALSWLLSAKAREDQKHEAVGFAIHWRESRGEKRDDVPWEVCKAREASKWGIELVDTDRMPDDPALVAIEGRGPRDARLAGIGYGGRVFIPKEVADLTAALAPLTEAEMRANFDPQVMEKFDVAGILWTEEEPDVLDTILIPIFNGLMAFYGRAARAGQYVLVVHG